MKLDEAMKGQGNPQGLELTLTPTRQMKYTASHSR